MTEKEEDNIYGEEYLKKIRRRMYTPTSRDDIMMMLDNKVKIITYNELENFNSIEELLEPYMSVVILYPIADNNNVGHWCSIFSNPGTDRLEYFDSYGCFVDDKIAEYNKDINLIHKPHKLEPTLLKLIKESKYGDNLHYNDWPCQSNRYVTSTCGLWCIMRLKNKHIVDDEFGQIYYDLPLDNNILPDLVISDIICNLYPSMCV